MSDWIGRTTVATEILDAAQCRRMQATLDRTPDLADGDAVPPGWHWLYFPDVVRASELGEEGHPRLGITMPPVPLPRRMWAGGRLEFHAPLVLGRRADRTSTIRSITPKEGRTGALCFVTVEHTISQDARPCLVEEQTVVYRGPSSTAASQPAPEHSDFSTTWHLDSTALFRYSALTFNGHRIHYDVDYSRRTEGYPDLVVHGPLLATLLLDLAVRHERSLRTFTYQARSPLFLPHPLRVDGVARGNSTELWSVGHHGGLAMQAWAE